MTKLACSRHAETRRRKRKEELKQDAADREAEEVERAATRQKREQEAQLKAEGQSSCLLCSALLCVSTHWFAWCTM